MVEKADVYVKNNLTETIHARRYCLPGDTCDLDISIAPGNEDSVHLVITETYLVVEPAVGVDPENCPFTVSNEELLSWETLTGHWKVEIKSNTLPPDTPTSANVDVGAVEPD